MNKGAKSASERLAAAKRQQSAIKKQFEAAEAQRRAALLADDDVAAARADNDLAELRLAERRVADKIGLLEPLAQAENQHADWPDDVRLARTSLQDMERRYGALQQRRPVDRSAADQTEIDGLANRIPAMRQHIEILERAVA